MPRTKTKPKRLTLVSDDRIQVRFTALENCTSRSLAWDTMWDVLFKTLAPYALAIAEREETQIAA